MEQSKFWNYFRGKKAPSVLANAFFYRSLYFSRVVFEEVETHGNGDAENQVAVQRWLVEDFIDVVSCAANLTCQPTHTALVGFELSPDDSPDMYFALVFHRLGVGLSCSLPLCNEKA